MEKYYFKTNALLKNLVGKDLINDDNIAIVELVKNAYDARSPSVTVQFDNVSVAGKSNRSARLVIHDAGTGMRLSDLTEKWLNIAYSEKKASSQHRGAYYAGNKGVGRFSCDRLGAKLDLLTRAKGDKLYHLPISWTDFEVEGQIDRLIQNIPLTISNVDEANGIAICGLRKLPAHGTILVISELRSVWDRPRLLDLKRALERFLNPNQLFERNHFVVSLQAPDFANGDTGLDYHEKVNGPIQNQIFEKLKFNSTFIESHASATEKTITTSLTHDGQMVYKVIENNDTYRLLEDVHVIVYYLNPYKKAYFTRQTGTRSIDFGSIFLFLNGFRVAPYGDRGDDWLGLDVRKTQGTARFLSSRDVVGRIEVNDSKDAFQAVSSREGLKNTPAFSLLREAFFLDVLRRLERFVVDGLSWDSVPPRMRESLSKSDGLDWENTSETYLESSEKKRQRIALSIISLTGTNASNVKSFWFNSALLEGIYEARTQEVQNLLAEIEGVKADKVDPDLQKGLTRIRRLITEKDEAARAAVKQVIALEVTAEEQRRLVTKLVTEKETYRAQSLFLQSISNASVGDLVAFHHQISHDSTIVENYIARAMKSLREPTGAKEALGFLEKAWLANKRMAAVAQFASKANFRAGMKKEPTDIPAFIEQYLMQVAKHFSASGLTLSVDNQIRNSFELKVSRIELSILIDNIVSNASKAMAKKMVVTIQPSGANRLVVRFTDDGRGLSTQLSDFEQMFEMGVTTTTGSGLGLYHARRIAESMDGTLRAAAGSPKGMIFSLELTR